MRRVKLAVVILTVLAVLLTLASCGRNPWAVKIDGTTYRKDLYLTYLFAAYDKTAQTKMTGIDDIFEQQIEGKDAKQYIKELAIDSLTRSAAVDAMLADLNASLPQDQVNQIVVSAATTYQNGKQLFEYLGISQKNIEDQMMASLKSTALFNALYGQDGKNPVTEEELLDYFYNGFYRTKFIGAPLIDPSSGAEFDGAAKQEVINRLDGYRDKVNNGEDIEPLQEAEEALNPPSTEDETEDVTGADDTARSSDSSYYIQKDGGAPDEILKALADLEEGKATTVTYNNYYFVINKMPMTGEAVSTYYNDARQSILHDMRDGEFGELIDKKVADMNIRVNYSLLDELDPQIFRDMAEEADLVNEQGLPTSPSGGPSTPASSGG